MKQEAGDSAEENRCRLELLEENRELRLSLKDLALTAKSDATTILNLRAEVAKLKATASCTSTTVVELRTRDWTLVGKLNRS